MIEDEVINEALEECATHLENTGWFQAGGYSDGQDCASTVAWKVAVRRYPLGRGCRRLELY